MKRGVKESVSMRVRERFRDRLGRGIKRLTRGGLVVEGFANLAVR